MINEVKGGWAGGQITAVPDIDDKANRCALMMAYALVMGQNNDARWFFDILYWMLVKQDIVSSVYWRYHGVGTLMIHLYPLLQRDNAEIPVRSGAESGPYRDIIESWNNSEAIGSGIYNAAEFHCQRIDDTSRRFFSEFSDAPFDLIPMEILAIYTIRNALSLETPIVNHPLLEPPFGTPSGSPSDINDNLLERVWEIL